mmetsp:Transcript_49/g.102  ORF Transcript_49/g.102 Transcript_49/m.102 type:complete len:234 (-) Transcript_49:37-738(-)
MEPTTFPPCVTNTFLNIVVLAGPMVPPLLWLTVLTSSVEVLSPLPTCLSKRSSIVVMLDLATVVMTLVSGSTLPTLVLLMRLATTTKPRTKNALLSTPVELAIPLFAILLITTRDTRSLIMDKFEDTSKSSLRLPTVDLCLALSWLLLVLRTTQVESTVNATTTFFPTTLSLSLDTTTTLTTPPIPPSGLSATPGEPPGERKVFSKSSWMLMVRIATLELRSTATGVFPSFPK